MPECGSQIYLCDLPIRFDTYSGCEHGCTYCFARKKKEIETITPHESVQALRAFIEGRRNSETTWCDWNIPLHWGGMSDPFQPIERGLGRSRACLELFAQTGYPFVVSTKGRLIGEPAYTNLLAQCNAVVQVSIVSTKYDIIEPGAPPFEERLAMLYDLSPVVKRLIVRAQPYVPNVLNDVLEAIPRYAAAGVYGLVVEGLKRSQKSKGLVKVGGDWVYPIDKLQRDFTLIKEACHQAGLQFFCAENRLRWLGDSPTCCGAAGVPGFQENIANLNHLDSENNIIYTDHMHTEYTAKCFRGLVQNSQLGEITDRSSYYEMMQIAKQTRSCLKIMGFIGD